METKEEVALVLAILAEVFPDQEVLVERSEKQRRCSDYHDEVSWFGMVYFKAEPGLSVKSIGGSGSLPQEMVVSILEKAAERGKQKSKEA